MSRLLVFALTLFVAGAAVGGILVDALWRRWISRG